MFSVLFEKQLSHQMSSLTQRDRVGNEVGNTSKYN